MLRIERFPECPQRKRKEAELMRGYETLPGISLGTEKKHKDYNKGMKTFIFYLDALDLVRLPESESERKWYEVVPRVSLDVALNHMRIMFWAAKDL